MSKPPRYTRDLIGYGPKRPDPDWPDGARLAVQCVLHFDPGETGQGAYGARVGFWRLRDLFVAKRVPVTVCATPNALERCPEQLRAMRQAGWEIALTTAEAMPSDDDLAGMIRQFQEVTGVSPRGCYGALGTSRGLENTAQSSAFDYVCVGHSDDLPVWVRHAAHQQLVLPMTYTLTDQAGDTLGAACAALLGCFVTLYEERGQMLAFELDCGVVGRPAGLGELKHALDHMPSRASVWWACGGDIADHWRQTHPPASGITPSQMPLQAFVKAFGSVYSQSPWIAERAWHLELSPTHDRPIGLASAFARVFRAASQQARLVALQTQPEIAGEATRSPVEAAEHAHAGLDILSESERHRIARLNTEYTARHGFPFVLALRDHSKPEVIKEMETRLPNPTEVEFEAACRALQRIALLRLTDLL